MGKDDEVCALFTMCDVCLTAGCFYVGGTCVSGPANGVFGRVYVGACVTKVSYSRIYYTGTVLVTVHIVL